jgi:hypothetical protein
LPFYCCRPSPDFVGRTVPILLDADGLMAGVEYLDSDYFASLASPLSHLCVPDGCYFVRGNKKWPNMNTSLREAAHLKISVVFPQGHSQGIFALHCVDLFCVVWKVS